MATPTSKASARMKTTTVASIAISLPRGISFSRNVVKIRMPHQPSSRPMRALQMVSSRLSVTSWRVTRQRPAPSAISGGQLLHADTGARQRQVRDVHGADEEHEKDAAPQQVERALDVSHDFILQSETPPCEIRR